MVSGHLRSYLKLQTGDGVAIRPAPYALTRPEPVVSASGNGR